jgi:cell division septation protein DedD
MTGKRTSNEPGEPVSSIVDTTITNRQNEPIDTSLTLIDEQSEFPRVASVPINDKSGNNLNQPEKVIEQPKTNVETKQPARTNQNSDLYKTPQTETRVGRTIYFDGTGFNVQVSSWRNKGKAEDEVRRLRSQGFNAFLIEANLPQKGGMWYRVRIGSFKSGEEAEQFLIKNNFEK